jgi:hypothetical protein
MCGNIYISIYFSFVLGGISFFQQINKRHFNEQFDVAVTYICECSLRNRLCLSGRRYINIVTDFRIEENMLANIFYYNFVITIIIIITTSYKWKCVYKGQVHGTNTGK